MTLKTLANNVVIQGDVKISVWNDYGDEVELEEFRYVDGMSSILNQPEFSHLRNLRVKYMFVARDEFLHIELEAPNQ